MIRIIYENNQADKLKNKISNNVLQIRNKINSIIDEKKLTQEVFENLIGKEYFNLDGSMIDINTLDDADKKELNKLLFKERSNYEINLEIITAIKSILENMID